MKNNVSQSLVAAQKKVAMMQQLLLLNKLKTLQKTKESLELGTEQPT